MTNFDTALDYTFANEGGFSNAGADKGGATRYGITRAEASRWYKRPVSVAEMQSLPIADAKAIYSAWYWRPLDCDAIKDCGVAVALFDIGVVRGIGVPPRYAQKICVSHGAELIQDGHIGPETIATINALPPPVFIRDFSAMVEAGFRSIVLANPSQIVFLKGWVSRAQRLLTLA